jgi:MraZ protein
MYRGINAVNLDTKGRMAIPMRYRLELENHAKGQLVVTIDTEERCLLLYGLPEWEVIESRVQALPSFNPATRRIQRLLIGHATEVELDASGRILLPSLLRDYAKLEKRVILVGQMSKFEIWSEDVWQGRCDSWIAEGGESGGVLVPELQTLSL